MDSRFLSSEEQAIPFPLKTSSHHQIARNLFYPFAFCPLTNFPFAEPPGTWLNAGMAAAGNATCMNWHREQAGGISGRNLSPAADSNVFWVMCTAHIAQKLWGPCSCLSKGYFELLCTDLTAQSTLSMPANSFARYLWREQAGKDSCPWAQVQLCWGVGQLQLTRLQALTQPCLLPAGTFQ